jgi:hypothetical protein
MRGGLGRNGALDRPPLPEACPAEFTKLDGPLSDPPHLPRQRRAPPGSIARTVSIVSASSGPLSSR